MCTLIIIYVCGSQVPFGYSQPCPNDVLPCPIDGLAVQVDLSRTKYAIDPSSIPNGSSYALGSGNKAMTLTVRLRSNLLVSGRTTERKRERTRNQENTIM